MDNKKISKFADSLREKIKADVILNASRLGITEKNTAEIQEFADSIVINGQVFDKKIKAQRADFLKELENKSYNELVDEITYTWFNRFAALKFMSENKYIPINVFGSADSSRNEPELLTKCLDINFMELDKKKLIELKTSGDDEKLYKFLIISLCNHLHDKMPFLFEKIQDYTELMFPEKLLNTNSIVTDINEIIPKDDWKEVEIIGWLYQDYINPRKNKVFADLKKNVKISKENIPAATQLFTPKWIVKYLVENSVGRVWLESNPNSELQSKFKYFIEQEYEEPSEKVISPEEIMVLDPAMGSGHMLVYAFDILYQIYKSQGYVDSEIAQTILNKNLYGLEIDNRATQLAGFALLMKARSYDGELFNKKIDLNLVSIEETPLTCPIDKNKYPELHRLLNIFDNAKNYGSLLNVSGFDFEKINNEYIEFEKNLSLRGYFERNLIKNLIKQAKIMGSKYDVVVTNPPYMGSHNMNLELKSYLSGEYKKSKSDFMTVFIEKSLNYLKSNGFEAMITLPSWMFIKSFEEFRLFLLEKSTFKSVLHLGRGVFGSDFGSVAFIIQNGKRNSLGIYKKLFDKKSAVESLEKKEKRFFENEKIYLVNQDDFLTLPGYAISYWSSEKVKNIFRNYPKIDSYGDLKIGIGTGSNDLFMREWFEVNNRDIELNFKTVDLSLNKKWYPYNKGGEYRKWYGNCRYILNWKNDGEELRNFKKSVLRNQQYYFKKSLSWSKVTIAGIAMRAYPKGFLFDVGGCSIFLNDDSNYNYFLATFNSMLKIPFIYSISQSVNYEVGILSKFPIKFPEDDFLKEKINQLTQECIDLSKEEWDSRETSWDFKINELLRHKNVSDSLEDAFKNYCKYWEEKFFKLHENEEKINQLFIELYDLEDELDNKVPLDDVTILKDESEINNGKLKFKKDVVMKHFLSYIVGCIFGRYVPEKEGLILANQGETINDFGEDTKFKPDDDNIVPITDRDYFPDDIVRRVKEFLKLYFGEQNLTENLDFIASTLNGSGSSEEKLRKYFLKDFYKDHVKMYNKKPIYWLFTSGKEQGFNALIYVHRYNKELLAKMRVDYLHKLQDKIDTQITPINEDSNEQATLKKQYIELQKYDELLSNFALDYVEIDLDDGVSVNYKKFESLTGKI